MYYVYIVASLQKALYVGMTNDLLRRLRDVAERFRDLFASDAEFDAYFPAISMRTDMDAARQQQAAQQLNLFA